MLDFDYLNSSFLLPFLTTYRVYKVCHHKDFLMALIEMRR